MCRSVDAGFSVPVPGWIPGRTPCSESVRDLFCWLGDSPDTQEV